MSTETVNNLESAEVREEWRRLISNFKNGKAVMNEEFKLQERSVSAHDHLRGKHSIIVAAVCLLTSWIPADSSSYVESSPSFTDEGREESVTPIEDGPADLFTEPFYDRMVTAETFEEAFPLELRSKLLKRGISDLLHRQLAGNRFFTHYWMLSNPKDIVYGLKVWELDGDVWYVKRVRFYERCWDSMEEASKELDSYESRFDGYGYDKRMQKAGDSVCDFDLLVFLADRGCYGLWKVLMGMETPAPGRRLLQFPTMY